MNDTRRTWGRLLAILVALTLVAAACGNDDDGGSEGSEGSPDSTIRDQLREEDADSGPAYGGRVVVGLEAETSNWLPGSGQFVVSGTTVAHTIYDPLILLNGDGEFEPYLAEDLQPNDDLTEWTLTLRSGITFHDGSALDADGLKWNFDTLHNIPDSNTVGGLTGAGVLDMEVVDDLTVRYLLSEANAAFPDLLRGATGWPVSQEAYESLGRDAFGDNPVGTGPFEFVQWTRDDRIVVRRNADYWRTDDDGNQLPYLDEIEFRPITDEDSRVQSLAADSVQILMTLRGSTAKQVIELVDARDFNANVFVGNQSGASIFNVLEPPVDDLRIRRALAYAGDPDAVAVVLGDDGLAPITTGFFGIDSPWYSDVAAAAYPGVDGRDLDAAIELVEEYRNDPDRSDNRSPGDAIEIIYSCQPDPSLLEIGQLLQGLWGEAGIEVELRQVDQQQHVNNAIGSADSSPPWRGDFMVNCWRAGAGEGDPLTGLQSFFGDPLTTPLNFTNFSHPEIDEALEDLRTNADFEVRYAAAETINRISNENVPLTWSVATPTLVGWRGDIRGITSWVTPSGAEGTGTPGGYIHFSQVYLSQG